MRWAERGKQLAAGVCEGSFFGGIGDFNGCLIRMTAAMKQAFLQKEGACSQLYMLKPFTSVPDCPSLFVTTTFQSPVLGFPFGNAILQLIDVGLFT